MTNSPETNSAQSSDNLSVKQEPVLKPPSNPYDFAWQFFSLRFAGWILFGIALILLLIVFLKPSVSQKVLDMVGITDMSRQDPLTVDGIWTYETDLKTQKHPNGYNNYLAYKGENTIKIGSNNNGYIMTGERTHAQKTGEVGFTEVDKQPIDIDNVGADANKSEIYFTFVVSQNNGRGYAVLKVNANHTKMDGTAYYLFPDGSWDNVKMRFYK